MALTTDEDTGSDAPAIWCPVTVNANDDNAVPSPRAGHTLIYNERAKECVVFGGASHEDGLYNDTYLLKLGTATSSLSSCRATCF